MAPHYTHGPYELSVSRSSNLGMPVCLGDGQAHLGE